MTDATPLASEQITQPLEPVEISARELWSILFGAVEFEQASDEWRGTTFDHAHRILAALSATPAPNGVVPLDEPNCTNDDYLRRKALTEMVAMDEQMEAEHPGWMTGEFTPAPSDQDASQAQGEVERLVEPWKDHHGPLPDYDSPIACVFDAGVQYAVELLAKELGVTDWTPCDGTEEYDGDLGGTLMNIVCGAMPFDQHGERMCPRDVVAALSPAPGATAQDGEAWRNDPASLESGLPCPSSLDGRHQVDTSMESGPNNCFHCEAPMGGKA